MSTSPQNTRYHHGDLRRALLEAAMETLETEGTEKLGLRELARALGVSPAAPYRHFDSKQNLLEALAVTGFQRFAALMKSAGAAEEDELHNMGRAYVRFALENPNLFRLMFAPTLRRDQRPNLAMAADAAFAGLKRATASATDGRIAALAAWSKVHGLAVLLLDGQIVPGPGEDIEALIAAVVAGTHGTRA